MGKLIKETWGERFAKDSAMVKNYNTILEQHGVPMELRPACAVLLENQKKAMASNPAAFMVNEGANTTGDVATMDKNIMPMITRGIMSSIAAQVCGLQPSPTDTGVFFYRQDFYSNSQADPVNPADGKIIIAASGTPFAVGGAITSAGTGVGVVKYKEDNKLYISVTSGAFVAGENLDNASPYSAAETTCSAVFEPEIGMQVFGEMFKNASLAAQEAATTAIKEVELGIFKDTVTIEPHKLRMRYTWEVINRLRDYHNLDAEAITDATGGMAMNQELNMALLNLIKTYATSGGTTTFNYSASTGRWEIEKYKELLAWINRRSADILVDSHMGLGNYLIISPKIWAALDAYNYIDKSMLPGGMAEPARDAFVGVLLGRYKVFVNIWETSDTILMGYKDFSGAPDAELRAGLFFVPYLPVASIKTIDAAGGQPVKFFTSYYSFKVHPYATKNGSGNAFFRRILCTNMPT